jgi:hypothetical protein
MASTRSISSSESPLMMRVSVASTGREPPDHCDQKQSDQENTRDDRGVDVVEPHHLRFSAISPVRVR